MQRSQQHLDVAGKEKGIRRKEGKKERRKGGKEERRKGGKEERRKGKGERRKEGKKESPGRSNSSWNSFFALNGFNLKY